MPTTAEDATKTDSSVISQPNINHPLPPQQHQVHPDNIQSHPSPSPSLAVSETPSQAPQSLPPQTVQSLPPQAAQTLPPNTPSPLSNPQLSESPAQQHQQQQPPPPQQQQQQQQPPTSQQPNLALTAQQIHQQMLHQVGCKMSKYVSRTHFHFTILYLLTIFFTLFL